MSMADSEKLNLPISVSTVMVCYLVTQKNLLKTAGSSQDPDKD